MKLGAKITKLRAGRSYAEIARVAGCSSPTVRDIESGHTGDPGIGIISALARHFGVSLDWLVDDDQGWPAPPSADERIIDTVRQALAPYGGPQGLTEDERRLLAEYRQMNLLSRSLVLKLIAGVRQVEAGKPLSADEEQLIQDADRALRHGKRKSG